MFKALSVVTFLSSISIGHSLDNPYLDLDPKIREELSSRLITPNTPAHYPKKFINWYNANFCTFSSFCFPLGSSSPEDAYHEWIYNWQWSREQRVVVHCNFLLLREDDLLAEVYKILTADTKGSLRFLPVSSRSWFVELKHRNYTANFKASRDSKRGLRSSRIGLALHTLEHEIDSDIEVHFDFENPGRYSEKPWSVPIRTARHIKVDLNQWEDRTSDKTLKLFSERWKSENPCAVSQSDMKTTALGE